MLEVTFFENDLELGTFDIASADLKLGAIIEGRMKIVAITLNPSTGEDAVVAIEYV